MESSAGRLLALLSLLQTRPHWTAGDLAERLAVTTRTVRRDMNRLRDLGYPVNAEPGPTGGYQLGSGGRLPPLLLTDKEAVAVAVGLRAAASGGIAGYEDAAVAALAKLEQLLPAHLREQVTALSSATVLLRGDRGPLVDPDTLLVLAQGCRRPERLTFDYRDAQGRETHRRVEPYRLVNVVRRWYLAARDLDRDDWRTFRVDRIADARLTGHRFVHAVEPDAGALVSDALSIAPYQWRAEVLLHADMAQAAEEVSPSVGVLEETADGVLLRLGADTLDWIARYLAGLPFGFEILDPPELRRAIRVLTRRLNRIAAGTGPGPGR